MTATIVYLSRKGRTASYARSIAMYLWSKGLNVSLCSISDFKQEKLATTDFLLLGCWTSGWFVVGQHPHSKWVEFARTLPPISCKLLLFSTYKFRTGSLFRAMTRRLQTLSRAFPPTLKSKTGLLSTADKAILDEYIKSE